MRIKSRFVRNAALAVAVLTILGACERLRPVYEVHSQAVPGAGTPLTLSQVENRIIKAGASLGWLMKPLKPGLVRGTIRRGRHSAVVNIEYDTSAYSILYGSSQRLSEGTGSLETRYEGEKVIHKRYNRYVKNLNRQIETYLLTVGS